MVSNGDGLGTQLKAVVIFVQTENAKKTLMAWGERVGEGVDFRRECQQAHNNSKSFSVWILGENSNRHITTAKHFP